MCVRGREFGEFQRDNPRRALPLVNPLACVFIKPRLRFGVTPSLSLSLS